MAIILKSRRLVNQHTCVYAVVPLQIIIADESFLTLITLVWFLPRVSEGVASKLCRGLKRLVAVLVITPVRLLFLVNTSVDPVTENIT